MTFKACALAVYGARLPLTESGLVMLKTETNPISSSNKPYFLVYEDSKIEAKETIRHHISLLYRFSITH